ncbi:hypothetical protein, partial [Propionivibrio sp.]|uniref:hypothetical protein n=1 Tax=Propionivibrio sp. TaxID=2212460 RepID=UPI003BF0A04E
INAGEKIKSGSYFVAVPKQPLSFHGWLTPSSSRPVSLNEVRAIHLSTLLLDASPHAATT